MPQSQVFTLDNADEHQAAILAGAYEVFVKSTGDFHAHLTRIDLHRLWMQRRTSGRGGLKLGDRP